MASNLFSDFDTNYFTEACYASANPPGNATANNFTTTTILTTTLMASNLSNQTGVDKVGEGMEWAAQCLRENSVLFLLLMLGTVWVGTTLFNFTKT